VCVYNRLDFEAFAIAGPNSQTVCATDNFRVSGTANKVPIICGQNVGQHSKLISVLSSCISGDSKWRPIRFQCTWLPRRRLLMSNWYSRWALARHRIVIGRSGSVYFPALLRIYLVVLLSALRHKDRSYNFILFLFKKLLTIVSSISRKVSGLSDRLIGVKCRHRRQGPVSWPIRTTTFASGRSRLPTPTLSLGYKHFCVISASI
jgi:hypothetical protein